MRFRCYHGTDYENAEKILSTGFLCRRNKKHWLGNGVYFFLDCSLAEWWNSNPTNKFGVEVKTPAIIECTAEISDKEVLDLRKLNDYTVFSQIYRQNFLPVYFKSDRITNNVHKIGTDELRCSFCDYISKRHGIKAIIGTFNSSSQPYLPVCGFGFSELNMPYFETQVCVFDQSIIKSKALVKDALLEVIFL
jgi:hypothetical protein